MSLYLIVVRVILLLIMAIATLKILRRAERLEKLGIQYIDCGTSGGVYGLERDIVLWLGVQILQYPLQVQSLEHSHLALPLLPAQTLTQRPTSAEYGWLHCGPPGAGHFVKMVHNGVEYGIMQAYAEGFNILHEANAGSALHQRRLC